MIRSARRVRRECMTEFIGWASSAILLATIGKQIHKQWHDDSSAGVSKWLFIGQFTASAGFTVYSFMVRNWVFVVTNALMAASAITGLVRSEEHTSELQSQSNLVCRLLLEKKKTRSSFSL